MQAGIQSAYQLGLHDHSTDALGGPILTIERTNSANVRITNAPQVVSVSAVPVKLKQTVIRQDTAGAMTINYTVTLGGPGGTAHGQVRVYRGATLLFAGVDNSTAGGPTVFTEGAIALDLLNLDSIEIWGYRVAPAAQTIVEAMEICFDAAITEISQVPVNVGIALAGAGVNYTNVS